MAQAAFAFPVPPARRPTAPAVRPVATAWRAAAATRGDPTAHALGRDHAVHGVMPPPACLYPGNPVREGWLQARARGAGPLPAPGERDGRPAVQAWLALRLQAWKEGIGFDTHSVTPALLSRLVASHCPITRAPLPAEGGRWVRLRADTPYEAGTLAHLSPAAAEALHDLRAEDLPAWAETARPSSADTRAPGLDRAARARLATLRALVTPAPHARAARLPLCALPTPRLQVVNPVQALQVVLTLQLLHAGYSQRIEALAALMPDDDTRRAFKAFMVTLLARRLAAGRPQPDARANRRALEDAWTHSAVLRAWVGLSLRLDAATCTQIVQRAEAAGLCSPHVQTRLDEAPVRPVPIVIPLGRRG